MGFNPRPSSLTGEPSPAQRPIVHWGSFNPRPSSLTGEPWEAAAFFSVTEFQSTPVITDGRAGCSDGAVHADAGFNPRPSSLTGEPANQYCKFLNQGVSIHARHH